MEEEQLRYISNFGSISSSSAPAIDSYNIGFQLLKKHGWKEGTGLGASEQGRLEPVEMYFKKNKRGLGAEKMKKKFTRHSENRTSLEKHTKQDNVPATNKEKTLSKRTRKMQEAEKSLQEKEFERAFFREFWPDNV